MTKSNFISLLAAGSRDVASKDVQSRVQEPSSDKEGNPVGRWDVLRDDLMLNSRSSLKVCTYNEKLFCYHCYKVLVFLYAS